MTKLFYILVLTTSFVFHLAIVSEAAASRKHIWPDDQARLQFHLSARKGGAVLYDGALVMPSFFGRIEHYQRDLSLKRKRLANGPWRGLLTGDLTTFENGFTLTGQHDKSAFRSEIRFVDHATMELKIRFQSSIAVSGLSIEIFKLSANLYKNSPIRAEPPGKTDIRRLPLEPRDIKQRFLLRKKNRIQIKSPICDILMTDLNGTNTLNVADFRSVPWDSHKSFYFYTDINLVPSGDWIELDYRVQFFPPSIAFENRRPLPKAGALNRLSPDATATAIPPGPSSADPSSFFYVAPRYRKLALNRLRFEDRPSIYTDLPNIARLLADDLQARHRLSTDVRPLASARRPEDILIELLPREERDTIGLPPEGFQIEVTTDRARVAGADERGCLFGAYALSGLITAEGNRLVIPCGVYRDWPDLPVRAICLELLPSIRNDLNLFKAYLRAFSRARANTVIFHHSPRQLNAWKQNKNPKQQWPPDKLAAVAEYARTLKMDVWAGLIHKLAPHDFPDFVLPGTNIYDPTKAASFDFLYAQYRTLIGLYRPTAILIGHDEIIGLSKYARRYGQTEAALLADSVNKLHRQLQGQSLRTLMWGDMLLDHERWQRRTGNANSGHALFKSGDTALALGKIDRAVTIIDWHYKYKAEYPSIGHFRKAGFNVLGCTWHDPAAAKSMAESVRKFGGEGVVATDWGFWRTLSPSATTLYSPLSGWHTDIEISEDNADIKALAGSLRERARPEGSIQKPLSLAPYANASTLDTKAGDKTGFFDLGPIVDLRSLPAGSRKVAGIDFLLSSPYEGRAENCIVVDEKKNLSIRLDPATSSGLHTIGFIHTAYTKQPQYRSRGLGTYVFTFTDGTEVKADIIEGWNITDIRSTTGLRANDWSFDRSPDELIGAYPAWRGRSAADVPLNLQMWLWTNPYPAKTLKTITIKTARIGDNVKIALLAATAIRYQSTP